MVCTDHGHAGKLALRAGHGGEAHALHARDFLQHLLQLVHAGQKPLRLGPERMPPKKFRQHGEGVACLRVVFHGAGTERIEMRVDGEIHLRKAREMAHRLQLRHLGQRGGRRAAQMRGNFRRTRDRRRELRPGPAARPAQFEYQRFSCLQIGHCRSPITVRIEAARGDFIQRLSSGGVRRFHGASATQAAARDDFMMSVRAPA